MAHVQIAVTKMIALCLYLNLAHIENGTSDGGESRRAVASPGDLWDVLIPVEYVSTIEP